MDWWEWLLWMLLATFYIVCFFTVCRLTFQKGYTLLGIVGIFIPFLWLIGAVMPAKRGSRYQIEQETAFNAQMRQYTS